MNILYILVAILLIGILVTVHELGHFLAARITGIGVKEFAVGWGPKLLSRVSKKSGIRYSLRALPLGGFCAFYSADEDEQISRDDPRCFNNAKVWKRMITVLMGPMMNFILAFVVLAVYLLCTGTVVYDPYVSSVEEAGPAYVAGVQAGDAILAINEANLADGTADDITAAIASWQDGDAPLTVSLRHEDGTEETVQVTPFYDEEAGRPRMGVMLAYRLRTKTLADGTLVYDYQPISLGEAISGSWDSCVYAGGMIITALKNLVTTGEGAEDTTGIIGTVAIISEQVESGGLDSFINLLIVISINLGIMNLLPFPGLDGSRFVFMVVEAIRRKPVPEEKENLVHAIGIALLLALMVFLMFKDTIALLK